MKKGVVTKKQMMVDIMIGMNNGDDVLLSQFLHLIEGQTNPATARYYLAALLGQFAKQKVLEVKGKEKIDGVETSRFAYVLINKEILTGSYVEEDVSHLVGGWSGLIV